MNPIPLLLLVGLGLVVAGAGQARRPRDHHSPNGWPDWVDAHARASAALRDVEALDRLDAKRYAAQARADLDAAEQRAMNARASGDAAALGEATDRALKIAEDAERGAAMVRASGR